MQTLLPFVLALGIGFTHAFEADHLVAMSSLVTQRDTLRRALTDGLYWGLGHTSTILVVGTFFMLGKFALHEGDFQYLEIGIGIMLLLLGAIRLYKVVSQPKLALVRPHNHGHRHNPAHTPATCHSEHRMAYGVGLMHGLAGSGALILFVLTQIKGTGAGMLYLTLFGLGSIGGMIVAAGVFSIPFSARLTGNQSLRTALVVLSSVLCVALGGKIVYENLLT